MVRVAEYRVIRDTGFGIHAPGREEHFHFTIPPEIVRPSAETPLNHRRPILTYFADPSSNAEISMVVEINDQRVVRWTYQGGTGRSHQEILSHDQLRVGDNTIQFRVDATEGSSFQSLEISDVIIWFQIDLAV